MLLDALASKADLHVPVGGHGSYAADLHAFLDASFALGRTRPVQDALRALMAHAQIDRAFHQRFRTAFLDRRRAALAVILDRARARGELPTHPSPEIACDLVFGVIWYRMLATGASLNDELADELVAILTSHERSQP